MRSTLASTLAAAIMTAAAITSATLPASASAPVNWHQRTCAAFRAWDQHRTAGRLHELVADSFHVAPRYLGADVAQLYADIERGKVKYLGDDATFLNQDCGG